MKEAFGRGEPSIRFRIPASRWAVMAEAMYE
jgi:hypothetical protein